MNMPFVEIVGAGPGAEDLITVRGLRALQQADLVVYAGSLVAPALLRHCRPDCLCRDSASMDLAEQVAVMSEAALAGKRVVRLHTGDPALYGAIDEQIRGLAKRGITVRITPGVSSVFAAAAALGCELTGPGTAQSVVLTRTPGRTPMPAGEQAAAFARTGATLAFFLSTGKVADLMAELQDAGGLAPDTPAAAVYRASWPDEQVVRGTVADLARKVEEAGFRRQSLILVGRALAASATVSRLYDGSFSHGYRNSLPDEAFLGTCALYAASPAGLAQARTLAAALAQGDAPAPVIFAACPADDQQPAPQPVADMAAALADALPRFDAHIILGTPRQVLPLLPAATGDAAVICCAESGRHAVCLLDGPDHAGDRLTRRVARITGGLAITGPTEAEKENDTPAAVSPAATTASAVPSSPHGEVLVVGLGSGDPAQLTPEVDAALRRCDTVAGYSKYVDFIRDRIHGKRLIETGMKGEVERCRDALAAAAAGATVCMVCSGDPGILAMAGLLFELRAREQAFRDLPIRVLPGITAASTAAAALGAPLQNGFSLVSHSDLLVPADEVRRNLRAVAQSALPVTLYNPAGRKRRRLLAEALDIFREARGGDILCAFVRHAGRPEETRWIGRLADLPADDVDMSTLVLIGSARTVTDQGALFEARGYAEKYLDKDAPASTADGR
ncbi:precorrin-4 C(11)-methyltransferase [Desulfovibrio piger]|uniref:precorrin-4 C(11)-methyltransferase n=1 Tax=Desulfovibrio piger TaxID=901 RepID=UPI0026EFB760|nr:precorrin-4 C(11)-methyltransferase [Desulfovibrio piger]MDD6249367.1 precorrin-4 C(11)-methyltransferase [Desulfovibrio piger]